MAGSLFAYPSDDIVAAATLSMTNEDTDYPDGNLQNENPADTAKSTTTSTTVTVTASSAQQIVAAAYFNSNATTASVENDATLNQSFTIPSRTTDGQIVNPWKNLTSVANNTDDVWRFVFSKTGSEVWEGGRLVLSTALRDLDWIYPVRFGVRRPGVVVNTTRLGTRQILSSGVRQRFARGVVRKHTALALFQELDAQVNGSALGFLFIPESDVNDAWFATLAPSSIEWSRLNPNASEFQVEIVELCMGAPPTLT